MAARQCISCNATPNELKVLRCLHTACYSCAVRLVQLDNSIECPQCESVTPSPGIGKRLSATLPTIYCNQPPGDVRELPTDSDAGTWCEECTEDTPAAASCNDCHAELCETHAGTHPRARRTRGHKVGPKEASACAPKLDSKRKPRAMCALHIGEELNHYCKKCMDLSCAICVKHKAHADHPSDLVSIAEAANNSRKECDDTCNGSIDDCHAKLTAALQFLQEGRNDIRRQSEATSQDIAAAFERKISLLKRRESQLLSEVDKLCWKKLEPLESECAAMDMYLDMLPSLASLVKACAGDSDVLRLSPWLKETVTAICKNARNSHELVRKCEISCLHLSKGPTEETTDEIGLVLDRNDVDMSKLSFDVLPLSGSRGQHLTVTVTQKQSQGELLTESSVYGEVSVVLRRQSDRATGVCTEPDVITAVQSTTEPSQWSCHLERGGRYEMHVKFGNVELNGSPCDITVGEMELDRKHCENTLFLSFDLTSVSTTGQEGQRSVYMTPVNAGIHQLRVKFISPEGKTGQFPVCGIVDAERARPLNRDISAGGNFIGLSSGENPLERDGKAIRDSSSKRAARWQSGAIFKFCLDCDRRIFSLHCEQSTGNFDVTWKNIPCKVCVRLGLVYSNSSFEVLPG